ncbi:unnamed protein product [Soboliphyme baturini]|uniref:ING domain-containing protein n=1 Tax=Soboliphyme baturini TaxID=241478 RepID=A0A183IF45_9BILA|nr:unnamed protein product [Soboliphyme baturini]
MVVKASDTYADIVRRNTRLHSVRQKSGVTSQQSKDANDTSLCVQARKSSQTQSPSCPLFLLRAAMSTETETFDPDLLPNVPRMEFIADVDQYMAMHGTDGTEKAMAKLEDMHQRYKLIEESIYQKKLRLRDKIDDLVSSGQLVDVVHNHKKQNLPIETRFMLADQCYVKSTILPCSSICLWLGVSYSLLLFWSRDVSLGVGRLFPVLCLCASGDTSCNYS